MTDKAARAGGRIQISEAARILKTPVADLRRSCIERELLRGELPPRIASNGANQVEYLNMAECIAYLRAIGLR